MELMGKLAWSTHTAAKATRGPCFDKVEGEDPLWVHAHAAAYVHPTPKYMNTFKIPQEKSRTPCILVTG